MIVAIIGNLRVRDARLRNRRIDGKSCVWNLNGVILCLAGFWGKCGGIV